MKRYLCGISLWIMVLFFTCGPVLALDEFSHKTKFNQGFKIGQKEMECQLSHKAKYDFDKDDWKANEYALEFGLDLIEHLKCAVEYKYIHKKDADDGEEIEAKLELYFTIPYQIELKDENKLITEIREGNHLYENELEICKEVVKFGGDKSLSLLVGDKVVYDFQDDKWTENEVNGGVELALFKGCKCQVKYCYVDVIDSSDDSDKVETEISFSF